VLVIFTAALFLNVGDVSAASGLQTVSSTQSSQQITTNTSVSNSNSQVTTITESKATPVSPKVTFTTSQINAASVNVKSFVDTNDRLPNYVTVSKTKVTMPQFLQLLVEDLYQVSEGTSTSIVLKNVKTASNPIEDVKSGTLPKSEYLDLALQIDASIDATGNAPDYVNSTLGKISYETLIYTYSKIMSYYNTNQKLPDTVSVNSQVYSTQSTTTSEGANAVVRPIYIVSDNITGTKQDKARINSIINALKSLGVTAVSYGIGPQYHLSVLNDKNVPKNALIVEIAGGACAGTIWEKGTSWYKKLVSNKKVFIAFTSGATKITGLEWLPRSKDDNFSPSSFKGLANPDQYLINNGYDYFEGLTNNNINQLAQAILNSATT